MPRKKKPILLLLPAQRPLLLLHLLPLPQVQPPHLARKRNKKRTPKEKSNASRSTSASPKKKPKNKTHTATTKRKTKPTYERMIFRALKSIHGENDRSGSSVIAISKYIENTYPVEGERYKRYLKQALRRGVEKGNLIKMRASYRLSAKAKASRSRSRSKAKRSSSSQKTGRSKSSSSVRKPKRVSSPTASKKRSKKSPASTSPSSSSASASAVAASAAALASASASGSPTKLRKSSSSVSKKSEDALTTKLVGSKYEYAWQYYDTVWKNYDVKASDVVEDVYQKYLENRGDTDVRAVKSGQWEYMVDFMAMKQTNIQHANHTVRNIRRVKIAN